MLSIIGRSNDRGSIPHEKSGTLLRGAKAASYEFTRLPKIARRVQAEYEEQSNGFLLQQVQGGKAAVRRYRIANIKTRFFRALILFFNLNSRFHSLANRLKIL